MPQTAADLVTRGMQTSRKAGRGRLAVRPATESP